MGAVLPPADDPVSSGLDDAGVRDRRRIPDPDLGRAPEKFPAGRSFPRNRANLDCPGDRADQPEGHRTGIAATLRKSIEGP